MGLFMCYPFIVRCKQLSGMTCSYVQKTVGKYIRALPHTGFLGDNAYPAFLWRSGGTHLSRSMIKKKEKRGSSNSPIVRTE